MKSLFLCFLIFHYAFLGFSQSIQPPMDPLYGMNGMVKRCFGSNNRSIAFAGLPLPDGTVLVTGSHDGNLILAKLKTNGQPDSTFATNGVFGYKQFINSAVLSLAIDSNNRIYLAGRAGNASKVYSFIIRLKPVGSIDSQWSQSGIWISSGNQNEELTSLIVTPNQHVIAISNRKVDSVNFTGVVRIFASSGTLDSNAYSNGSAIYAENSFFMNMHQGGNSIFLFGGSGKTPFKPILLKIDENGFLDSNFGVSGFAVFNQEIDGVLYSLIEDRQGFLIGGGEKEESVFRTAGFLVKLKPTGTMHNSFGVLGNMKFPSGTYGTGVRNITRAENNTFLVTGFKGLSSVRHTLFIIHYDATGNPINDFGTSGSWEYKTDSSMSVWDVKSDPVHQGKIYLFGTSAVSIHNSGKYFVMRLRVDPKLNTNQVLIGRKTLKIQPNPTSYNHSSIVIIPETGQMQISDITGKIIFKTIVFKGEFTLTDEVFKQKGTYVIQLQTENSVSSEILICE